MEIILNGNTVNCESSKNLLEVLRKNGEDVNAVCGGKGTCGKCLVRIKNASVPTPSDRCFIDEARIKEGIRLACKTGIFEGMEVETFKKQSISTAEIAKTANYHCENLKAIADIGTTTLALALINENGEIIDCITENNSQSPYGADVITRIKSSASDKGEQHRLIISQTEKMLIKILRKNNIESVEELFIAGNTTMMHLFFGIDCTSLGVFPYSPVFLESKEVLSQENGMNSLKNAVKITSLPCISSFVGADISAGVLCNLSRSEEYTLLIDLGTNAEIVLFNKDKYFASSAAAGPAFEGANIKNGMAAIPGALCGFKLNNGIAELRTVNDQPLCGICGSGLIDLTAELLNAGLIDEMGQLEGDIYKIGENVSLYAEDVREVQLAKSAVCSVVEMLVKSAGIDYGRVSKIYLSGGFGSFINIENARKIGLLPKEIDCGTSVLGNSCLMGTALYACDIALRSKINEIIAGVEVLDFAHNTDFSDRFIENIMFF